MGGGRDTLENDLKTGIRTEQLTHEFHPVKMVPYIMSEFAH